LSSSTPKHFNTVIIDVHSPLLPPAEPSFSLLPFHAIIASRHCRHCFRHAINTLIMLRRLSAADFHY
jgi:hypothetical protein